jgi:hypothetical protein
MTDFAEGGNELSGSVKTATIKSADVCSVMQCSLVDVYQLPEERTAFVLKVEM